MNETQNITLAHKKSEIWGEGAVSQRGLLEYISKQITCQST